MSWALIPRWPPAWTEAALVLALACVALAGVRAAGWFPFPPASTTRDYWRPRGWAGLALGAPALALALLLGRGLSEVGLAIGWLAPALAALPLGGLLLGISYAGARRRARRRPSAAVGFPPSRWAVLVVILSWAAYLLGYEVLFRGALLFAVERAAGGWPAVVVSTAVYALAHLDKGAGETLGSLVFGVVLAVVALEAGSVLAPFLLHLALAVGHELGGFAPRAASSG